MAERSSNPRHASAQLQRSARRANRSSPATGVGGDADLARAAWAFAHGMVQLELAGRFPPGADLPAAWHSGVAALEAARR